MRNFRSRLLIPMERSLIEVGSREARGAEMRGALSSPLGKTSFEGHARLT